MKSFLKEWFKNALGLISILIGVAVLIDIVSGIIAYAPLWVNLPLVFIALVTTITMIGDGR